MMNSTNVDVDGEKEEPFALKMVLRLFYVTVFLIGLCGNLLVLIVVIQQRRMRTVMNCFTLNLAISDLIIIVIYLPTQYAAYENGQNWPFGNVGCRITYSIVPVCLSASIGTLLAISCERFRGIVLPFQPRLRLRTVRKIIIIIWIVSIFTALPLMIFAGTIRKGNNTFCDELWPNPNSLKFYWIAIFLLQYVIPLIVMTVLYGVAGWKLQKRSGFLSTDATDRPSSINFAAEVARQRQSLKITKMLIALILIYSFCILPQHVVYFWTTYGNLRAWKYFLYVFRISNVFTMANSALNSIVYGTLQTDFRKAYRLFFLKYNLCLCKAGVSSPRHGKPYNKIAFRLQPAQRGTLDAALPYHEKIKAPETEQENGKIGTTSLRSRLSSDSRSPLIFGDSTSDYQQSNLCKNKMLHQNGEKKELNSRKNVVDAGTTNATASANQQTHLNHGNKTDHNSVVIFGKNITLEDAFLLKNAKETDL